MNALSLAAERIHMEVGHVLPPDGPQAPLPRNPFGSRGGLAKCHAASATETSGTELLSTLDWEDVQPTVRSATTADDEPAQADAGANEASAASDEPAAAEAAPAAATRTGVPTEPCAIRPSLGTDEPGPIVITVDFAGRQRTS